MSDDVEETDDNVTVMVGRSGKRGSGRETDPVQNTEFNIPIFPDLGADARHVIVKLEIFKLTGPGEGAKGYVPPTSTLEAIGRRFGDGRYNIHAINQSGKVLRRQDDVAIAVNGANPEQTRSAPAMAPPDLTLLKFQADQHEKDAARVAGFAKESNDSARAMTEKHLAMVERQHQAQVERDRAFFEAQATVQRDFFAGLLTFTQQAHQQTMQQQAQMFQQTITMMEQGHQRALASSDPLLMLSLFKGGIEMGQGLNPSDSDNPVVQTMKVGLEGVKEVRQMMMLRNARPPANMLPNASTPPKKTKEKAGKTQTPPESGPTDNTRILGKVVKLKETLESKGYDVEGYLDDVLKHIEKAPEAPEEDEQDESDDDAPEGGSATGPT